MDLKEIRSRKKALGILERALSIISGNEGRDTSSSGTSYVVPGNLGVMDVREDNLAYDINSYYPAYQAAADIVMDSATQELQSTCCPI